MTRPLPTSASVAVPDGQAKLHAPSAARNATDIAAFLTAQAPQTGRALEIASGTGQHIVTFAAALPDLQWQPTDVAPDRLRSIDAHVADAALDNVNAAVRLDAFAGKWAAHHPDQDLIVLINLLHLISDAEALAALNEIAQALAPGGTFILYGPFKRKGTLTSAGDARFDAELRAADPAIGYKDTTDITPWLGNLGLTAMSHEMPANNLAFVCRKPAL